jgi:hypothetical protein
MFEVISSYIVDQKRAAIGARRAHDLRCAHDSGDRCERAITIPVRHESQRKKNLENRLTTTRAILTF